VISNKRLWLNADRSAVVSDGDPAAAFLLAGVGGKVPTEYVDMVNAEPDPEPEVDPDPEPEAHVAKPAPVKRPASKPTKPTAARK